MERIIETEKGTIKCKELKGGKLAYYLQGAYNRWYRLHSNRPWTDDQEYIDAYLAAVKSER